jgi:hypothetical protein
LDTIDWAGRDEDEDSIEAIRHSLLRDMATVERDAIIARLSVKYGLLPSTYTTNGIWVGPSLEERARIEAQNAQRPADLEAKKAAKRAECESGSDSDTTTADELRHQLGIWQRVQENMDADAITARLAEVSA